MKPVQRQGATANGGHTPAQQQQQWPSRQGWCHSLHPSHISHLRTPGHKEVVLVWTIEVSYHSSASGIDLSFWSNGKVWSFASSSLVNTIDSGDKGSACGTLGNRTAMGGEGNIALSVPAITANWVSTQIATDRLVVSWTIAVSHLITVNGVRGVSMAGTSELAEGHNWLQIGFWNFQVRCLRLFLFKNLDFNIEEGTMAPGDLTCTSNHNGQQHFGPQSYSTQWPAHDHILATMLPGGHNPLSVLDVNCTLPFPTDSRWTPDAKELNLPFCIKSIWSPYGLHLESRWIPSGIFNGLPVDFKWNYLILEVMWLDHLFLRDHLILKRYNSSVFHNYINTFTV